MGIGSFSAVKSKFEMRKIIKIPRILKINWIKDFTISVVFNNGESRTIDFEKLLKKIKVEGNSPAAVLFNQEQFEIGRAHV